MDPFSVKRQNLEKNGSKVRRIKYRAKKCAQVSKNVLTILNRPTPSVKWTVIASLEDPQISAVAGRADYRTEKAVTNNRQ